MHVGDGMRFFELWSSTYGIIQRWVWGIMFKKVLIGFALVASVLSTIAVAPSQAAEEFPAADGSYPDGTYPTELLGASLLAEPEIYPLVFPVLGKNYFSDTWGACRDGCSRTHIGTDILTYGMKGLPVVAAHAGVVETTSTGLGRDCCAIWGLIADDGWQTWYIHMNNDTPGTDDGQGWGFADGIELGVRVEAGQLIGWVGDSGNAEWVAPQIHFELRKPNGTSGGLPINPYPSLLAATQIDFPRLAGPTRYETAAEIALDGYSAGVEKLFVTTGQAFPDALAVGAVAASEEFPVILTKPESLPASSGAAIAALQPEEIVIIGGTAAVSAGVEETLAAYGPVTRIGGVDRYETASMVAENLFKDPSTVYVAFGYSYPEAVSAAVAAGSSSGPLILTQDGSLTSFARRYLASLAGVDVVVVGGEAAVNQNVGDAIAALPSVSGVTRIDGAAGTDISVAVSKATFSGGSDLVYLATAEKYPDALAGASLAGRNGAPVVLISEATAGAVDEEVARLGATDIIVLGGTEAIPLDWLVPIWNRQVGNTMPIWHDDS
jgi:putative cell wall-binding protein